MATFLLVLRLFLSIILYSFLGLALYILWRNLQADAQPAPEPIPTPATLIQPDKAPSSLHPFTSIGRAADNALVLSDPFVSNHHALIFWQEENWWLEDLASHNGTYLNGKPVSTPVALTAGDTLIFGETNLDFIEEERARKTPEEERSAKA